MTAKEAKREADRNYIDRKVKAGFVFKRVCLHHTYLDEIIKDIRQRNRKIGLEQAMTEVKAEELCNPENWDGRQFINPAFLPKSEIAMKP